MSIISLSFLVFVLFCMVIYYALPQKWQWVELLIMSLIFYCLSIEPYTIIYVVISTVSAYSATCLCGMTKGKYSQKKLFKQSVVFFAIFINIGLWFLFKGKGFWGAVAESSKVLFISRFSQMNLMAPLAMGYYTLQVIGYILDCYWGVVKPQKNILKLFLFVVFFPQLITGPISRYGQLESLYQSHLFSYKNVTYGAQRILWGFFKKLVIAERVSVLVNGVWSDLSNYTGYWYIIAFLLYPLQVYTDFSGCMDIVLGVAEIFGIKLPENFNNPFMAKTLQEIWQRWHISLGLWAKDYIMFPLLKSRFLVKMGVRVKKKFGKRIGKLIPTAIGMLGLWIVLGIWHGEFKYIIGVELWYWSMLVLGEAFRPILQKLNQILGVHQSSFSWRMFQRIRTYFIFAVGLIFFRVEYIREAFAYLKVMFLTFGSNPWIFFNGNVLNLGVSYIDINLLIFSTALLIIVAILREKNGYARDWMAQQILPFRWGVWIMLFVIVLVYGKYGPGYDAAEFIYKGF